MIVGAILVLALGGAGAVWGVTVTQVPSDVAPTATAAKTTTVARGDLALTQEVEGQVGFGETHEITSHRVGTLTWLPEVGTIIRRGEPLMRVDERSVPLFLGETPVYRALDGSGLTGRDVQTAADNLIALGFLARFPEGDKTGPLFAGAAKDWRASVGLPAVSLPETSEAPGASETPEASGDGRDGAGSPPPERPTRTPRTTMAVIEPGDVIVHPTELRVAAVLAQRGNAAGDTAVLRVTGTAKSVSLSAESLARASLAAGAAATIVLPDGRETPGTVRRVGAPTGGGTSETAEGETPTVVIDVDEPTALDGIDSGPVRVRFTADKREGVLVVAASALLALREGGYALEREDGTLIPVTTGLFAGDRVEVSGEGLVDGMTVLDAA